MTTHVDEFLTSFGVGGALLAHKKEATVDDMLSGMSSSQRDLVDTIVGAAVEGTDLADASELVDQYIALSDEHKNLIDFLVGNILARDSEAEHGGFKVANFLSHFGVKGMKWGVIRDRINSPGSLSRSAANTSEGRKAARARVAGMGGSSSKDSHLASLKSTGHRAINAFTGDKTFWRRTAYASAASAGILTAGFATAGLLPAGALAAVGSSAAGAALGGGAPTAFFTPQLVGQLAIISASSQAATAVSGAAGLVNVAGNTVRSVAGNAMINRSYAKVGKTLISRQKTGRQRVLSALRTVTGTRDKDLRHSDISFDEILHALEPKSGGGGEGKGKRKFDETKVKRDGDGQFSSNSGNKKPPAGDVRTPEQIDSDWKKNIGRDDALSKALWSPKAPILTMMDDKIASIKKSTGVDLTKESVRKTNTPAVVKAANELMTYMGRETNKYLSTHPAAVSPSGTKRVQLRVINAGTNKVDFKYVFVDNKLKHDAVNLDTFLHAMDDEGELFGGLEELLKLLNLDD